MLSIIYYCNYCTTFLEYIISLGQVYISTMFHELDIITENIDEITAVILRPVA
jgi:hypothetical protein